MNTSEEQYRIAGMSEREVEAFYRRCLPSNDDGSFQELVTGGNAGPGATRTYEVLNENGGTVVRVRCSRCY